MAAGGSGIYAQLGAKVETTPGTQVVVDHFVEFNTESIAMSKNTVQGQGLHAGGLFNRAARRAFTTRDVSGGFSMNVPNRGLGFWLQAMVGSYGQTLATPTASGTTGFKSVHVPGTFIGKTLTIQKGVSQTFDGTVHPFTYVGTKVLDWEIACQTGAIATCNINIDAWDELTLATTPASNALATAVYPASAGEFQFQQGSVLIGGTTTTTAGLTSVASGVNLAAVTGASIKGTNALKQDRFFFGNTGRKAEQLENGWRGITGQLDMEFYQRTDIYDLFRADTQVSIELKFIGPQIGAGPAVNTLDVILPAVFFDGGPPVVGGPDISTLTATFTALDDGTTNPTIQFSYISLDSTL